MTNSLGQLLLRDGRLSAERLEEVYQRQVLYGGQLDTHVLELGLVDETTLLGYLSRASGLPAIGRAEIRAVSRDLLRLFPKRLAERYRAVPLRLEGRALHLACSRPLEQGVITDIGFTLSVQLVPHIASELRIAFALDRLYGVPLPARFENLLAQLGEEAVEATVHEAASAWVVDEPARVVSLETPAGNAPSEAADPWQVVPASAVGIAVEDLTFEAPAQALSELLTGGSGDATALATLEGTPVARLAARLRAAEAAELNHAEVRRQRVSWQPDDAAAELALAQSRDEIIDVVLRFAHKRLERVALFVLLGDTLVGWDAIGPDVETRVRRLRFAAVASPSLATVLRTRAHSLGPLAADDPLRSAFGGDPPAVLLLPLTVRDRLLGVLYGDCCERPIEVEAMADLEFIAAHVNTAFERVILKQKQEQWRDVETPLAVEAALDAASAAEPPLAAADTSVTTPAVAGPAFAVAPEVLNSALRTESTALRLLGVIASAPVDPAIVALLDTVEEQDAGTPARLEATRQLRALGAAALPALARLFPGRLRRDLFASLDRWPAARELSAVCDILIALGPSLAAPLVVRALRSSDRTLRMVGLLLHDELKVGAAVDAVHNCLLDGEERCARYAADLCTGGGRRALPAAAARLLDENLAASDPERVRRAIRAAHASRDRHAVGKLIGIVDGGPRDLAQLAAQALVEITRQDFGLAARKWRRWQTDCGEQRRVEWLLSSLDHKEPALRECALQDLRLLSGDTFGFRADAGRPEREAALARWSQWWQGARQRTDLP